MKYDAIIFDLDGTAIPNAQSGIPSPQLSKITNANSENNLSAATGRAWEDARPVIKALGLTKPCIIGGGAMIINPDSEDILWQEVISVEAA